MTDRSDSQAHALEAFARAVTEDGPSAYPDHVRFIAADDIRSSDDPLSTLLDDTLLRGVAVVFVRDDGGEMMLSLSESRFVVTRTLDRVRGRVRLHTATRGPAVEVISVAQDVTGEEDRYVHRGRPSDLRQIVCPA